MANSIDNLLAQVNEELKAAKCGVVIRIQSDRLSLRATFPPRPGSDKTHPYQQDLALGIYANPAGFKRAKSEALRVGGLLACKEFSWDEWLVTEPQSNEISISDWLQRFEKDYFNKRARTPKTQTSFRDYLKAWELCSDRSSPLTPDAIYLLGTELKNYAAVCWDLLLQWI